MPKIRYFKTIYETKNFGKCVLTTFNDKGNFVSPIFVKDAITERNKSDIVIRILPTVEITKQEFDKIDSNLPDKK